MWCERIDVCPFINKTLREFPVIREITKKNYCLGNEDDCAHYRLYLLALEEELDQEESLKLEKMTRLLHPSQIEKLNDVVSRVGGGSRPKEHH